MKAYAILLLSLFRPGNSQTTTGLVVNGFVDVQACYAALQAADTNTSDRFINADEYVTFVQQLGPSGFLASDRVFSDLPLILRANFNVLACLCETNGDNACCTGSNARIDTAGAFAGETPTPEEQSYLFLVCSLTTSAINQVLQSKPPTSVPTQSAGPSMAPTAAISLTPTYQGETRAPTPVPVVDLTVNTTYQIGLKQDLKTPTNDLVSAMNILAPKVLSGEARRRLRGALLESVLLPTSIDSVATIGNDIRVLRSNRKRNYSLTSTCVLLSVFRSMSATGSSDCKTLRRSKCFYCLGLSGRRQSCTNRCTRSVCEKSHTSHQYWRPPRCS